MTNTLDNTKSVKYSNAEGTAIDCMVVHPVFGSIPFTASPADNEEYGRSLYAELKAGVYGEVLPYVPPV